MLFEMKVRIKIPRDLVNAALHDLERPHGHSLERVGFFSVRYSADELEPIVMCFAYHSVDEDSYLETDSCGARIGGDAIRVAMQRSSVMNCGQLWVHTHGRHQMVCPSRTDRQSGPKIIRSLANLVRNQPHGWMILSESAGYAEMRLPDESIVVTRDVRIVGRSMGVLSERMAEQNSMSTRSEMDESERYDRQSFLGKSSRDIFETVRVGLVGLGGGGSHINQQLAHLGFKHIVYCDPDGVEKSNLNRLIGAEFDDAQIGTSKTEVATRLFKNLHPDCPGDLESTIWQNRKNELRACDIVFGCLDSYSERRDLEIFCRRHMIPLIDIGMTVKELESPCRSEIYGQVAISIPGGPCMRCLGVLTEKNIAYEVAQYGDAGNRPQVVWSNGVLASTAVGVAVELLTDWSNSDNRLARIDYRGSQMSLKRSHMCRAIENSGCVHFPLSTVGDPNLVSI